MTYLLGFFKLLLSGIGSLVSGLVEWFSNLSAKAKFTLIVFAIFSVAGFVGYRYVKGLQNENALLAARAGTLLQENQSLQAKADTYLAAAEACSAGVEDLRRREEALKKKAEEALRKAGTEAARKIKKAEEILKAKPGADVCVSADALFNSVIGAE